MSLFLGPMRQHIRGKKELTEKSELLHLMPKKEVYIIMACPIDLFSNLYKFCHILRSKQRQ